MRISKLARKYDLSNQELTSFLETLAIPNQSLHPNAKLDDETMEKVASHFGFQLQEEEQEEAEEKVEQKPLEEDLTSPDSDQEELPSAEAYEPESNESFEFEASPGVSNQEVQELMVEKDSAEVEIVEEVEAESMPPSEDEIILSDQLLEMIEAEETPSELEKIKLIKAPKKELSGLTVLGKIEIPEDPRKRQKEQKEAEKLAAAARKPKLTEAEREERRLKAKKKKEEYEARKEKRQKQQHERKEKARKAEHYKQSLNQNKAAATKAKPKKKSASSVKVSRKATNNERPQPRTVLGKFWRWLNSSGYD